MKKLFSILLVIVLAASVVFLGIGCKTTAQETTAAETTAAAEETTAAAGTTAAETAAGEKPYEGTTITVVYMSGAYVDAANSIKDSFKELTGIEVQVVDYPWEGLHEKVLTELIAGTGSFDMIPIAGQWMGELVPYLEDIAPYIESEETISDFQEGSYNVYNWSGVQYGFPYQTLVYSVLYRTDLFEAAGITPNPQWTWDEYNETLAKLTKDGKFGGDLAGVKHQQNVYFINRYWGLGGKTTTPDWEVTMDNETTIAALENLKATYASVDPKAKAGDISEWANLFAAGEVATAEGWPSVNWMTLDDPESSKIAGKWDILPTPGDGPIYASLWGIGINSASKNKEATYEWVKYYTSKESQYKFWEEFGMVPVRKSFWSDQTIFEKYPFFENYSIGQARATANWRISAANEGWEGILNDEVAKYLEGGQTAEQTAKNIQDQWTVVLQNEPAPEGYKNPE
jgi:multiple sugar transport system substrate-binding protein